MIHKHTNTHTDTRHIGWQQQNYSQHQKHTLPEYIVCFIVCVRVFMQYLCTFVSFHFSKCVYMCLPPFDVLRARCNIYCMCSCSFSFANSNADSFIVSYRGHRKYAHLTWCGICVRVSLPYKNLNICPSFVAIIIPTASWYHRQYHQLPPLHDSYRHTHSHRGAR